MIDELRTFLDKDINDLQNILPEAGFEIAYGDTYSLSEIRKAVCKDKLPVYAKLTSGKSVLFVGENKLNQLVSQDKFGNLFNADDSVLKKAWTGEVVIVTNQKPLMKGMSPPDTERDPEDIVLLNTALNSWDSEFEEKRYNCLKDIKDVKYLDEHYLPEHPVIVYFKKPDEKELKDKVRSYTKGVEICIIDPSDPYTEFLHELGHVFWSSRLNDEDKESFVQLHKQLDKDHLPPVLMDNWSWNDHEELFATIYMWYLKGLQKNPGYLKILDITYKPAKVAIENIFNRVAHEIHERKELEKCQVENLNEWKNNEKDIAIHLKHLMGKAIKAKVSGLMIKAKNMPHKDVFDPIKIPESVKSKVLGTYKNRKWHYLNSGILKGMVIVTNSRDVIDFDYMENKKQFYLVPTPIMMKANGKSYQSITYVRPEKCLESLQEAPRDVLDNKPEPNLIQKITSIFRKEP